MPRKVSEKVVFDSKWLQVVEATIEGENSIQAPYFYHRYPWTESQGVAILCYRDILDFSLTELGIQKREYLGRYEYIPAQKEGLSLCSLTGGYDKPEESFKECAIRELEEEGGLSVIDSSKVIDLGIVRNSKSSDNVMHLFAVDYKYCKEVEAIGDGTVAEQGSYVKWISEKEAVFCEDVLLPTMIQRLNLNSL